MFFDGGAFGQCAQDPHKMSKFDYRISGKAVKLQFIYIESSPEMILLAGFLQFEAHLCTGVTHTITHASGTSRNTCVCLAFWQVHSTSTALRRMVSGLHTH